MPIPIEYERDAQGIYEDCCFCFKGTPWWTEISSRKPGEQVACCQECAEKYRVKDVPSKVYWCEMVARLRKTREAGYIAGRKALRQERCRHTYKPGRQFSALWFIEVCTKCDHEKQTWNENHP